MQINNNYSVLSTYRLILLLIGLTVLQLTINSSTVWYVDAIGVAAIVLLMRRNCNWLVLIMVALYADLIGHWYLGSHLLSIMLISFLTVRVGNFYQMCGSFQKGILVMLFYILLLFLLAIISLSTHGSMVSWSNYLLDIFVICPLVVTLFSLISIRTATDIIY